MIFLLLCICFLSSLFPSFSFGIDYNPVNLKREYIYNDAEGFDRWSHGYCIDHLEEFVYVDDWYKISYVYPAYIMPYPSYYCEAYNCNSLTHYFGYVDPRFTRYSSHFKRQSELLKIHPYCCCYWPESSKAAGVMNDLAYDFIQDLLINTELSTLFKYTPNKSCSQDDFFYTIYGITSRKEIIVSFIAQQFFFSDYYSMCQDIEKYSKFKFSSKEHKKIKDKLDGFLLFISPMFLELYQSCLQNHYLPEVEKQIEFVKFYIGDYF